MLRKLRHLGIGTKLLSGFAFVAVLGGAVGGWELFVMRGIQDGFGSVYNNRVLPLERLKAISDAYAVHIKDAAHKVGVGLLTFEDALRMVGEARASIEEEWSQYEQSSKTEQEKVLAEQVLALRAVADERLGALEDILRSQDHASLGIFTATELYPLIEPITTKLSELVALQLRVAGEDFRAAEAAYNRARDVAFASILAAVLASIGFGLALTR
ncbi:MAG: MCP four helix bundle domain-containing protein, partial [Longimicrobiales bacterium]